MKKLTFVLVLMLGLTGTICADCPYGMVSYWRLAETSGTTAIDCYGFNDGTNYGATIGQTGQIETCYSFDGLDDYINCGNSASLDITNEITLETWVNVNSFGDNKGIISKLEHDWGEPDDASGYGLTIHYATPYNKIQFWLFGVSSEYLVSSTLLSIDTWYYVAATYDGSHMKLYINGVEDAITSATGTITLNSRSVLLGSNEFCQEDTFLNGSIDEVAIYNRSLSLEEIQQHYQAGLAGDVYCSGRMKIYVDANVPGPVYDGVSWDTAYNNLQDALNDPCLAYGDAIWVAAGTYMPSEMTDPCDPRTATFQLINGVAIYGGFPTGGASWQGRDPNQYETILSGDIGTLADRNDNSYHVVTGSGSEPNAVLDGFIITSGNANGLWPDCFGGGMYIDEGSPTVRNCTFRSNTAQNGGGLVNWQNSNSTVINCTFTGNSADDYGGGMFNQASSSPTVTSCTFSGNSAVLNGGGMFNNYNSSPTVTGCTFSGNSAEYGGGGGMVNGWDCSPTVTNCTFTGNTADDGGGILGTCTLTNCTFSGNSAVWGGGGMYGAGTLTNCTFSGNSATWGGGMFNYNWSSPSSPIVTNCTFAGNSAVNGSALACDSYQQSYPSTVGLANCILWDSGGEIWNNDGSTITITYSDVQGGWPGLGNIDVDPCFVDPGYWDPNNTPGDPSDDFWVDGDYHLTTVSPCIDTGDPCFVPAPGETDFDGEPRVSGYRVDMGADEFQISGPVCWACRTQCHGDADCDGFVNTDDWPFFRDWWQKSWPSYDPCADFNRDGIIDTEDWPEFRDNFQKVPAADCVLGGVWPPL